MALPNSPPLEYIITYTNNIDPNYTNYHYTYESIKSISFNKYVTTIYR